MQRILRTCFSALYLVLLFIGGFCGSLLLLWFARGREFGGYVVELVVVADFLGVVFGVLLWVMVRKRPPARLLIFLLMATSVSLTVFLCQKYIYVGFAHQFPTIKKPDAPKFKVTLGRGELLGTQELAGHIQSYPSFRTNLLKSLDRLVTDESLLASANMLLASEYQYLKYEPALLPRNLSWNEDPHHDRSWNFQLHLMDYVVTLTRAYEKSGDLVCLARAEDLVLDWISDNTRCILGYPSSFSWHDHATALRLMNWLYFFDAWRLSELAEPEEIEFVFRSMVGHASVLALESFYTHRHNHGIDQDRALLAFSMMHPYVEQSEEWKEIALHRLIKQVDFAISPQGIHLEHSPGYHLFGFRQLQNSVDFLDSWDIRQGVAGDIRTRISLMANYIPYIIKPDGNVVQVGDTGNVSITNYTEVLTGLEIDYPPSKRLFADADFYGSNLVAKGFVDEGYAIIRNFSGDWDRFSESFYFFFSAAAHEGRAHRHADDLSFVLSYGGRDVLVDPGIYSYKLDESRKYVVGANAHNSVVVDGGTYDGYDTTVDFFEANDRYVLIKASHRNYSKIEHTRWLIYLRPALLLVIDQLNEKESSERGAKHLFEQLFHFSPHLQLVLDKSGCECAVFADKERRDCVMLMTQLGDIKPSMRIAIGEHSPMQGWYSPKYAALVPSPVLISSIEGQSAEYITALEINNKNDFGEVKHFRGNFRTKRSKDEIIFLWSEGGRDHSVRLNVKDNLVSVAD